ncbi:MAG: C40 family peptidase, partial [Bacteroidota bacterium]
SGLTLFPHFEFKGNKVLPGRPVPDTIKSIAFGYLGAPYQWGGKSPFGIDCSGFTQMVFRINGIALPRDAWQQAETGVLLEKNDEVRTGDLAFFKNSDGKIVHVGIVLQQRQIIHASGEVRVDSLDQEGIFNNSTGKYSHRLDSLRRYF